MGRKRAVIAIAIVSIVAVGLAVVLLQPRARLNENGGTTIANATEPTPKQIVSVVSTRSAFPFIQRWVSQYNNNGDAIGNIEVSYYLEKPDIASNLMIVGDIRHAANKSYAIPVSAQAVAIVYNIPSFPDIPSGMKLDASLLASIFNGTVVKWNNPAIKDLNQGMNLPDEKIVVVHENGRSSSLSLLEKYLSMSVIWPSNSIGVLGPDELAATVRKTPYSIGYVDFSFATQTRMTFAAIANPHYQYVLPSIDSIDQAVNSSLQVQNVTNVNRTVNLIPPFINASMFGNSSYPVTGLYYAALPNRMSGAADDATLDFVRWTIDKNVGQQVLPQVQYPPIYKEDGPLSKYAGAIINGTVSRATKGG